MRFMWVYEGEFGLRCAHLHEGGSGPVVLRVGVGGHERRAVRLHRAYRAFPMNRSLGPLSLGHFSPVLPHFPPVFSPSSPSCPQDSRNRHQDPEKRSETVAKRSRKGGLKPINRKRRV